MPTPWIQRLKKLDKFTDKHALFFVAFLILVLLRIPNFYEPYWYGDEGIYLTIGQAMNKGVELYSEIVDHKTPIIYFLAQVGTQLNFRILNFVWMSAATLLFYIFAMRLTSRRISAGISTILFVLFTTLPWFEGNIPNGELFVIGFVMLGAALVSYTKYFQALKDGLKLDNVAKKEAALLVAAGVSFGLGILTKVPGLFDLVAFAAIGFFVLSNNFSMAPRALKKWTVQLKQVLQRWGVLIAGILLPIILSVLYFVSRGSGAAYLQYGLLYNFHYAGNWNLPFDNALLVWLFSLPGKFTVATILILAAALLKKWISGVMQFVFAWFVLALFASLLSNRPYPHYFLQAIPPLSLLVGMALGHLIDWLKTNGRVCIRIADLVIPSFSLSLFIVVILLLNVGLYPVKSYYQKWWQLRTGQISSQEYRNSFNHLMQDNYEAAALIRGPESDRMFVWGTNPMLYALSGATPTGQFTVAFHIKDLESYDQTMADLRDASPTYIVVMKEEGENFPDFYTYLRANYRPFQTFDNFTLWRKMSE